MNDARGSNCVNQRSCGDGLPESKGAKYGWIPLSRLAKARTAAVPINTWSFWRPVKQTDFSALRGSASLYSVRVNDPTTNYEETMMVVECKAKNDFSRR